MSSYKLTIVNDHPLVEIENRVFLLDSGAPSFSFDGRNSVEINGRNFRLHPMPPMPDKDMNMMFGRKISGFIGMDIIESFGIVDVDKAEGKIHFGESVHQDVNGFRLYNHCHFDVNINGMQAKACLDTGAHIPMVFRRNLINENRFEEIVLEPANNCVLELRRFSSEATLSGKTVTLPLLEADNRTMGDGSDVIMGINQFADKYYVIDLRNGRVYFE